MWPILEPQYNDHSQPLTIVGDLFFENYEVSSDLLLEEGVGLGAGCWASASCSATWKLLPQCYSWALPHIGATPGQNPSPKTRYHPFPIGNLDGVMPVPNTVTNGWILCSESYCTPASTLKAGGTTTRAGARR